MRRRAPRPGSTSCCATDSGGRQAGDVVGGPVDVICGRHDLSRRTRRGAAQRVVEDPALAVVEGLEPSIVPPRAGRYDFLAVDTKAAYHAERTVANLRRTIIVFAEDMGFEALFEFKVSSLCRWGQKTG